MNFSFAKILPLSRNFFVLALLALAAAFSAGQAFRNAVYAEGRSQDFQWSPSRLLLQQVDPYQEYLSNQTNKSSIILSQAPNYPASGLAMLWPYSLLDWPHARMAWALSNMIFTLIICLFLFRLMPSSTSGYVKFLLVVLLIMGTPWRNSVGNGQHAIFVLAFFLVSVVMAGRSTVISGVALAVSWFKYTIAFPLTFVFAKSYKHMLVVLLAALVHGFLILFLTFWVGSSPWELLVGPLRVAQSATGTGYIDVFAVAARAGITEKWVPGIVSLLILWLSVVAARREDNLLSSLSMLSLVAMAVVFHLVYDALILVLPLCFALTAQSGGLRSKSYFFLIGLLWFFDRGVDAISNLSLELRFDGLLEAYFWFKVFVFYGVLSADLFVMLRRKKNVIRVVDGIDQMI